MSTEEEKREAAIADYRKKLLKHKEIDGKVRTLRESVKELKKEYDKTEDDLKALQSVGQIIGEVLRQLDEERFIVKASSGPRYVVGCRTKVDKTKLTTNTRVALDMTTLTIMRALPREVDPVVFNMLQEDPGKVDYSSIGGLSEQIRELRESIELPLMNPELFTRVGIKPPKGVLLYGPPGTGKTLLARAVAHHTDCTFIRVSGSELVQKYVGEGARMVRELFQMARSKKACIVFFDEVDAIGGARFDDGAGGDNEVQRTMLEIVNQLDGFDARGNVKVLMATNRPDTLDPALLRPGRLDRKIEFPTPDRRQKRLIFQVCTSKMNLSDEVDLEDYVSRPDKISAAEIAAICQEAGMHAVRKNRYVILPKDFEKGYKANVKKGDSEFAFYQ
mmetsp:Transcript_18450/g.46667  ORF Transcript_18450/g.46667 Transcript_18450/m.46667 type:complete len:390 (-) Transcript_18450:3432-4601(-)